ncbi:hypothetical protein [Staphylococcus xylosus]|uniref:hypothetical protein n=1 Tax=Staphylococcus xylosus TaxID=1288 RepID=UPI003F56577A
MSMNLKLLKKSSELTHNDALKFLSEFGFDDAIEIYKEKIKDEEVIFDSLNSIPSRKTHKYNSTYVHKNKYNLTENDTNKTVNLEKLFPARVFNKRKVNNEIITTKNERIDKIGTSNKLVYVGGNI